MKTSEFNERMEKIHAQAQKDIIDLVNQAREESGLGVDNNVEIPDFIDYVDRSIDRFVQTAGWVYDRIQGKNRLSRGSMTKKLNKVLGYNQ